MADTVVYYSMSGKSEQTAREIAAALRAPLVAIVDIKSRQRNFIGFVSGILDSLLRRKPWIRTTSAVPAANRIILCGPIWAGRIAGPIRSWLDECGHDIADLVWVPHSGAPQDWPKAIEEIEFFTGRAPDLIAPFSEQDFARGVAADKARQLAAKLGGGSFEHKAAA